VQVDWESNEGDHPLKSISRKIGSSLAHNDDDDDETHQTTLHICNDVTFLQPLHIIWFVGRFLKYLELEASDKCHKVISELVEPRVLTKIRRMEGKM
jgi:hypothetical protein